MTTLARRQPMAVDLRDIVSTVRIASDLEHVGDLATNIAETAHYVITGEVLIAERPKGDESAAIEPSLRPPQA